MGELILVTGGSASGKSAFSEQIVKKFDNAARKKITYIATAEIYDEELRQRVIEHRERRPEHWKTVEACYDLVSPLLELVKTEEVILLDSLSMYVSNKLVSHTVDKHTLSEVTAAVCEELNRCVNIIEKGKATVVVVTDEVGWGIIPSNFLGRAFRDLAGKANQILGRHADEAYLVVSGLAQKIK